MKFFISFLAGALIATLVIFFIPGIIKPVEPVLDNGLGKIKIDSAKYAKFFSGPLDRTDAIKFSDEYLNFLKAKVPDMGEFDKTYTAGTYFTAEEIANYIAQIIKNNPGISPDKIRMHICTSKYPTGTTNPSNGNDVSGRLSASLIFFDASGLNPNTERPAPRSRLNFETSAFLGAYNWGSLEP